MTKAFQPRAFAPVWMAIIIDSMGFGLVYPILTLIFISTSHPILPTEVTDTMRHFYLGLGYLLYPMAMFFGAPILSDFSDRYGRRPLLLLALGGLSVSFFLMGLGVTIHSLAIFLIGRALSGLFAGSQPTAQAAIADLSIPETKKHNMSVMTFVISIGIILGPIVGGLFTDRNLLPFFSFSTPFYFACILCGVNFFWLNLKFPETFPSKKKNRVDWLRPLKLYGDLVKERRLFFLTIAFLLMQLGFGIFYQLIQVRMAMEFGYNALLLGLFNTAIGVSCALGIFLSMSFLLKVTDEVHLLTWTLLLTGLGITASSLVYNQAAIFVLTLASSGLDMIAYSVMMTCFSHTVSPKKQGFAMGVFGATLALAWTAAGFLTNFLTLMSIEKVILVGGGAMLIAGLLIVAYRNWHFAKT